MSVSDWVFVIIFGVFVLFLIVAAVWNKAVSRKCLDPCRARLDKAVEDIARLRKRTDRISSRVGWDFSDLTLLERIRILESAIAPLKDLAANVRIALSRCPDGKEHDKVYRVDDRPRLAPRAVVTTRDWVCRNCGMTGTDPEPVNEYDRLTTKGGDGA